MNADLVIGDADFTTQTSPYLPLATSSTTAGASGVVVDPSGNLWVADCPSGSGTGCRVLRFSPPFSNGMNADLVIGQPNFTSSAPALSQNGLGAMDAARGTPLVFDGSGALWVSDQGNNRVLQFSPPFSNGMNADLVIGQSDFVSSDSVCSANGSDEPWGIAFDVSGNLWVSDYGRILEFKPPFSTGMNASLVLGEPDFTTCDNGIQTPSQNTVAGGDGIIFDPLGKLWAADEGRNRVMRFSPPFSNGMNADLVLGQPNFTSTQSATSQNGMDYPSGIAYYAGSIWVTEIYNNRVTRFDVVPDSASDLAVSAPPTTSQILLSWTATGNPFGASFSGEYLIEASSDPAAVFSTGSAQVAISTANVSPSAAQGAAVPGLMANTTYYLALWSANTGLNYSGISNGATVATLADQVAGAQIYRVYGTSAAVNWQALPVSPSSASAEGYELDASTASDFSGTVFSSASPGVSLSALSATGLTYNTSYYFRVGALNWSGSPDYVLLGSTLTGTGPPPSNPLVAAVYLSSVAVSWGAVGALDGYELDADTAPDFSGALFSSVTASGGASALSLQGLTANATYYLRVASLWNGAAAYAAPAPSSTSTLAALPTALAPTSVASTSVAAAWGAGGNSPRTLYLAQVSTNGFSTVNAASATFDDSAVFAGLDPGTSYDFRVEAIGNDGLATGFVSLPSTSTLLASPGLGAPVFAAVAIASASVQWTSGGNPAGTIFTVELSTDNFASLNASSATAGVSAVFGTGGAGPALTPDTGYYFRVQAASGSAQSAFTALGSTYTLAEAPSGTQVPLVSSTSAALQWQGDGNPAGAGYQVWRDVNPAFPSPVITSVSGTSDIEEGLSPSTTYYFEVRAVNGDGVATAFDAAVSAATSQPSSVPITQFDLVRTYPNPYKPNGGNPDFGKPYNAGDPTSGILFDQMPAGTMIRLYTLTGRLVSEIGPPNGSGVIQWNVKNQSGQDVATGVYFAVLSAPGAGNATRKVMVVR